MADVVALGFIGNLADIEGLSMSYAHCAAYVPLDKQIILLCCPHTLPPGRRPPPATFRCALIQIAYADLYVHLISDPATCEFAVALLAEHMTVMRAQAT